MTAIRRILIGIVGLLLLLDVVALGLVKANAGPAPSEEKTKVVIWIDSKEQAKAAAAKLKEMDYEPLLKEAKRDTFVEADFRLTMSGERNILNPIANVLKNAGHKNVSLSEDGTTLYYGGVFKSRSEAERVARSVEAKERIVFDVTPGKKKVQKPSHRVILMEVPSNMVGDVVTPIETEFEVAEVEEEELAPPAEDAVEEEE